MFAVPRQQVIHLPGHSQRDLTVNAGTYLVFGPYEGYAEQLPRPFGEDESATTAAIVILPDGTSTSIITNPPDK